MSFRSKALVFVLAGLAGCPQPTPDVKPPATPAATPPTIPVPTLPPTPHEPDACLGLALDGPASLNALQEVSVAVSGGVGPFVFSLETNASGGSIQPNGGLYFAGPNPGTDTLRVDDPSCGTSATTDIVVNPAFAIFPESAVVPPGQSFSFVGEGGSGQLGCVLLSGSGSVTADCQYTAGPNGTDLIEVSDTVTGEALPAEVRIADVPLVDETHIFLPATGSMALVPRSGSGFLELGASSSFTLVDGVLSALEPEAVETLELRDTYTGTASTVTVVSAPAITYPDQTIDGFQTDWEHALLGDVDGDGVDDLLVANIGLSWDAHRSGLVAIYPGTGTGFASTPEYLSGTEPLQQFGRDMVTGDFNGDGTPELAVGSANADGTNGLAAGRVDVFQNLTTTTVLEGLFANDNFGWGLGVCDLNDDGFDDLLVGAPGLEDRTVAPTVANAGGVSVFYGSSGGLSTVADAIWYSREPSSDTAGVWLESTNGRAGSFISTGDLDGDGGCDVAIGGYVGSPGPSTASSGGVWVVRGEELLNAGLPARVLGVESGTVRLGRHVALHDMNGDGRDDLVAGARNANGGRGQVHIYLDPAATGVDPYLDYLASDLMIEGPNASAWLGWTFDVVDTGVGAGLMITEPLSDAGGNNVGAAHWFNADTLGLNAPVDLTPADADFSYAGTGGNFGAGLATLPDADGDGVPDVAIVAGRASNLGTQDSAVLLRDGTTEVQLDLEPRKAGLFLGTALAWSGDQLLTTAPGLSEGALFDSGRVMQVDGLVASPWPTHPNQASQERQGDAIASVGDLDGDGFEDFASTSQSAAWRNTYAGYLAGDCPNETLTRPGAVHIYRGTATGPESTPSWIAVGDRTNGLLGRVTGDFDFNGDGQPDLAVSGRATTSNMGAVHFIPGPFVAPPVGEVQMVCASTIWSGNSANAQFGEQIQSLPDLDGDGCDELVATSPLDDLVSANRGSIRVLWGTGGTCAGPRLSTFVGDQTNARVGGSLAAGHDLDADGLPDVLAGNPIFDPGNGAYGAAFFLSGQDILDSLGANDFTDTTMPGIEAPYEVLSHRVTGSVAGERFGASLGVMAAPDGGRWALVGRPGAVDGLTETGMVDGYEIDADGFVARRLVVAGDSVGSEMGTSIASRDEPILAVGAAWSNVENLDSGALYVFDLR